MSWLTTCNRYVSAVLTEPPCSSGMHECRLSCAEASPFPCLSGANPHIASSLETAAKKGGAAVHMPRLAAGDAAVAVAGISAFAFQGTNTHVLLSRQVQDAPHNEAVHQHILVAGDDPGLKVLDY